MNNQRLCRQREDKKQETNHRGQRAAVSNAVECRDLPPEGWQEKSAV
jgi:hypothetical protein